MYHEVPADAFRHRLRVRYCETDQMGVAHHGSHVAWFEEARTEWLRARGRTYREMEDAGELLQVVDLVIRYAGTVRYDDVVVIAVWAAERSKVAVRVAYRATREDGALVAEGMTRLACVGRDGKVRRLPAGV